MKDSICYVHSGLVCKSLGSDCVSHIKKHVKTWLNSSMEGCWYALFFLWLVIGISNSLCYKWCERQKLKPVDSFFFFFSSFCFLGLHLWHMEVPTLGVKLELSGPPMPQAQQHQIRAVSSTYTTAHGNAGSLTQWARPGIKSASSWMLVRFVSTTTTGTLRTCSFLTL